eukprot:7491271-Heterocapsa_arctica.AAC.1
MGRPTPQGTGRPLHFPRLHQQQGRQGPSEKQHVHWGARQEGPWGPTSSGKPPTSAALAHQK